MEKLVIRRMILDDLDEVLPLAALPFLSPWSRGMFIEEMKNLTSHTFVIKMKGIPKDSVVGFIVFRIIGDESELLNICVHPQYRRLGIGKKLMQFYISFSGKRKARSFFLEVHIANIPAIHFYESFSYGSLGRRKKFYRGELGEEFGALVMGKRSDLEVPLCP